MYDYGWMYKILLQILYSKSCTSFTNNIINSNFKKSCCCLENFSIFLYFGDFVLTAQVRSIFHWYRKGEILSCSMMPGAKALRITLDGIILPTGMGTVGGSPLCMCLLPSLYLPSCSFSNIISDFCALLLEKS